MIKPRCRFFAEVKGNARTRASRRGFKNISATINGSNMGIFVSAYITEENKNIFDVYLTGGYEDKRTFRLIKSFIDLDS